MLNVSFVSSDLDTAYIIIWWNRSSVVPFPSFILTSLFFYFDFMLYVLQQASKMWFIMNILGISHSHCFFTSCQLIRSIGRPLEATAAADWVAILVAHEGCVLIDCTGAQRGCYKPIALPSAAMQFSVVRSLPPPASHVCTLPLGHGSMEVIEVMEKAWACWEGCRK